MGLDISVNLVVGVMLKTLGSLKEETETVQLVTALGKPSGHNIDIRRMYLKTPKKEFLILIATNEYSIEKNDNYLEYDFYSMFDDDKEYDSWVHRGLEELEGTVIGLSVASIKKYPENYSREEQFKMTTIDEIQDEIPKVSEFLKDRFGYEGQVFVFSFASYSY